MTFGTTMHGKSVRAISFRAVRHHGLTANAKRGGRQVCAQNGAFASGKDSIPHITKA
ncbi:hypothetical protein J31TS3_02340 [Paenibacillus lactis]|jgi:hypothetical protein|nr:hypothetical protein J31TS3_02340 [Paenibacillus lactis]